MATKTMTGKVLDNGSAGILILILPFAFGFVVLYKLWPFLLLLAVLIIAFKIWQNHQWQKWCGEINPYFNQLIKENRGYLTPVDLSVKANITAQAAKAFLSRKSEEYGTRPKNLKDQGVVYYFPTASALGSILDDSEPEAINSYQLASKETNKLSVRGIAQLAKHEQNQVSQDTTTSSEASNVAQLTKEQSNQSSTSLETESEESDSTENNEELTTGSIDVGQSLIQAELAKRLDLNSSTVGRRKSDPDFEEWSQSKDPEGIAWRYESESKLFVAVDSN